MNILLDPQEQTDPGAVTDIPPQLAATIAAWAQATYKQYSFGHVLCEAFLHKLYRIYVYRFMVDRPAILYLSREQSTVALHFALQGNMYVVMSGVADILVQAGYYGFFYAPAGHAAEVSLAPGIYETLHIELEEPLLEELAESRKEIRELLTMLHTASNQGGRLASLPMDYKVMDILSGIRHCRETGGDLLVEFGTAISNLLNLFRKSLQEMGAAKEPPTAYATAMNSIKEEIARDPNIRRHTIAYFAQKHNMSESTLKRHFRLFFRQSLHEFVLEECMKKADWLRQHRSMSITAIADEVGYADRSSFIKAYKRFHNRTPGRHSPEN